MNQSWIERDNEHLQKLKIKLAVNKQLFRWGRLYVSQISNDLRTWAPVEMTAEVIEEMAMEGLLTKETSSRGALVIVYKATPTSAGQLKEAL